MATLTKVLTYDGLLYYTQLLRNKFNTKADKTELPSTIIVTPSSSNISLALSNGTTTGTATTLPIVDSNNAGLMTPTMLAKLNGSSSIILDGTNVAYNQMTPGNIYTKDGNMYIPVSSPSGNNYDLIEVSKDGIREKTNSGTSEIYAGLSTATTSANGLMSSADKNRLEGIETGAQVNVIETISIEDETSESDVSSITLLLPSGKNVTIPLATTSQSGLMSHTDKIRLNSVEVGAEVNVQSDWNQTTTTADDYIKNKPTLATVATSGSYNDLSNKPSIPDDSDLVHKTGNETIGGDKMFTGYTKLRGSVTGELYFDNDNYSDSKITLKDDNSQGWVQIRRKSGTNSFETLQDALDAKQNVIDSSHKLSADLISDGTTNKAYTATEKTKLSGIEAGAQVNVIEHIKLGRQDSDLEIDSNKRVTIPVDTTPTNNSTNPVTSGSVYSGLALKAPIASPTFTGTPKAPTATAGTNTTQIATTAFVQAAIAAAVTGSFKFVPTLPTTGEEGYIYLVPHTHTEGSTNTNPDVKDEYIWNTSANPAQWELIGNTDLDLSNYWNKTDLVALTPSEITTIWNTGMSNE